MTDDRDLASLLDSPPTAEVGRAIMRWVAGVQFRIDRGDMMIGVLSMETVNRVPEALRKAIECGVREAWVELGYWLADPPIGDPDIAAGEQVLEEAVGRGIDETIVPLVRLRWFLRREDASQAERARAYSLLEDFVAKNPSNADALHYLGLLTCGGFGTSADPAAAFQIQRKAAAMGNVEATFELYVHYQTGLGIERNEVAAFEANREAAEALHPRAAYNMGVFHATGQHVTKDLVQAAEWYQKASDAGNPQATAVLATMYAKGEGVSQDTVYAEELFIDAEDLGVDVSEMRRSVGME